MVQQQPLLINGQPMEAWANRHLEWIRQASTQDNSNTPTPQRQPPTDMLLGQELRATMVPMDTTRRRHPIFTPNTSWNNVPLHTDRYRSRPQHTNNF